MLVGDKVVRLAQEFYPCYQVPPPAAGVCSFDSDFARFPTVTWARPPDLGT